MSAPTEHPYAEGAEDSQNAQNAPFENDFSREVIGAAVEVQKVLGLGLLESAYAGALAHEMTERGLRYEREVPVDAVYKGAKIGIGYRADFIVQNSLILELKTVETVVDAHKAQLLSYLRLSGLKLGLLINFGVFPVVRGVHRVVNKL